MKIKLSKLFYLNLFAFIAYEFFRIYLIMPLPGSQQIESIELAYNLHYFRWFIRMIFLFSMLYCWTDAYRSSPWKSIVSIVIVAMIFIFFQMKMMADTMFYQPKELLLKDIKENQIPLNRQIIGIELNGEAKAYPISFLAYHHQVRDQINNQEVLVSYCSVCRSGRVFIPKVNGQPETFRLVGMDQFNAMFEDRKTGTWWRQENGEAVAGKLKGQQLEEFPSRQMLLKQWLQLYPNTKIMQADPHYISEYDSLARFEQGLSKGELTKRDSNSWQLKSWVVGISKLNDHIAIDWNRLQLEKMITFTLNATEGVLVLAEDKTSFFAFEIPKFSNTLRNINDTIYYENHAYSFNGDCINSTETIWPSRLKTIPAYQEFWHSWLTFHPNTRKY